ncbi:MAG: GNAT family N-acetyltransferase [Opitutaceae bacterium]|jgi:aminoglycoside 6'-N-acetyltransferase|nr:GNAT family N-acetyltransferase [Opitutaceae bacterium]
MPSVSLTAYDAGLHAPELRRWLREPHVTQWWGETTLADALGSDAPSDVRIIFADARPVGFLRWHVLTRHELDEAGLHEIAAGGADLDLLIGVPELLGQGIGSRALALAIGEITSTLRPPFFSLCTETANLRALRCYQKSGFNIARQFLESGKWHYFLTRPATP